MNAVLALSLEDLDWSKRRLAGDGIFLAARCEHSGVKLSERFFLGE